MPGPAPGETINGTFSVGLGAFLDAWKTYTPAWTGNGSTAPNLGNGTIGGRYIQVGKTVICRGSLVFGSTTTFGNGNFIISVPVTPSSSQGHTMGNLFLWHAGASPNPRIGMCITLSSTGMWLISPTGELNTTTPWTWAAGDEIHWTIIYEAL